MCESMIERVARAIYAASPRNEPFDQLSSFQRLTCLHEARAALEAMRSPTDAMLDSMDWYSAGTASDILWEAGIDAALNEQVAG